MQSAAQPVRLAPHRPRRRPRPAFRRGLGRVTSGGANRSLLTYSYDNDDNITTIADGVTAANSLAYSYDARGRLSRTVAQTGTLKREDIAYDANGNRTSIERRTAATTVAATQTDTYAKTTGTNRLASIISTGTATGTRAIQYDARGNTASETRPSSVTVATAYDGHARLVSYTRTGQATQANVYNGMDERVIVTNGTVTRRFVYDPDGRVIGEYGTSATNVIAERIWMTPEISDGGMFGGDDGTGGYAPIAIVIGTTLRWVHGNHLGVPATYTSNTGAAIATPAYTLPGFPGQYQTMADLYYNKYRDYDTSTGRYIQGDPIGLAGGQSPYSYAMGNPVRLTDRDGLFPAMALPLAGTGGTGVLAATGAFCATPVGWFVCGGAAVATVGGLIWYNWPAIDDPAAEQEHREYKTAYAAPMPPGMDDCEVLAWKLKREQELLAARMAWDANWQPGRHAEAMLQSQNAIRNIKDRMKRLGCKC